MDYFPFINICEVVRPKIAKWNRQNVILSNTNKWIVSVGLKAADLLQMLKKWKMKKIINLTVNTGQVMFSGETNITDP